MTSEQFHDALTLLPEDLIARADKYRCRKPKVIPMKRYAALAACFAVLLCSAAIYRNFQRRNVLTEMAAVPYAVMQDTNAADAEAPRMEAAMGSPEITGSAAAADGAISYTCVETPVNVHSTASFAHGPSASGITSRQELDDYLTKWGRLYLLDSLRDACAIYEEDWFASHDLLLIPMDCVTGPCAVTDVTIGDDGCEITIARSGEQADDQTNYHILLPLEKNVVSDLGNITIFYNSDTTD